jgi:hypothetical protein
MRLRQARVRSPRVVILARERWPSLARERLDAFEAYAAASGFIRCGSRAVEPIIRTRDAAPMEYSDLLLHASGTVLFVRVSDHAHDQLTFGLLSMNSNDAVYLSLPPTQARLLTLPSDWHALAGPQPDDLESALAQHLDQRDLAATGFLTQPKIAAIERQFRHLEAQQVAAWETLGWVEPKGLERYRLTWRGTFVLAGLFVKPRLGLPSTSGLAALGEGPTLAAARHGAAALTHVRATATHFAQRDWVIACVALTLIAGTGWLLGNAPLGVALAFGLALREAITIVVMWQAGFWDRRYLWLAGTAGPGPTAANGTAARALTVALSGGLALSIAGGVALIAARYEVRIAAGVAEVFAILALATLLPTARMPLALWLESYPLRVHPILRMIVSAFCLVTLMSIALSQRHTAGVGIALLALYRTAPSILIAMAQRLHRRCQRDTHHAEPRPWLLQAPDVASHYCLMRLGLSPKRIESGELQALALPLAALLDPQFDASQSRYGLRQPMLAALAALCVGGLSVAGMVPLLPALSTAKGAAASLATLQPDQAMSSRATAATTDREAAQKAWELARIRPPGDPLRIAAMLEVSEFLTDRTEARALLRLAIGELRWQEGTAQSALADAIERLDELSDAPGPARIDALTEAVMLRSRQEGVTAPTTLATRLRLARHLANAGRRQEALNELATVLRHGLPISQPPSAVRREASVRDRYDLAWLSISAGQPTVAARLLDAIPVGPATDTAQRLALQEARLWNAMVSEDLSTAQALALALGSLRTATLRAYDAPVQSLAEDIDALALALLAKDQPRTAQLTQRLKANDARRLAQLRWYCDGAAPTQGAFDGPREMRGRILAMHGVCA